MSMSRTHTIYIPESVLMDVDGMVHQVIAEYAKPWIDSLKGQGYDVTETRMWVKEFDTSTPGFKAIELMVYLTPKEIKVDQAPRLPASHTLEANASSLHGNLIDCLEEIETQLRDMTNDAYNRGLRPAQVQRPDGSLILLELLLKKMEILEAIRKIKELNSSVGL